MNRYFKEFGYSQKQIAYELGITQQSLSYKLNFYRGLQLNFSEIVKICDYIGCDYCEFIIKYVEHKNNGI